MTKSRGLGSVKRFGTRYGRKVRAKLQQVELEQHAIKKCPYCSAVGVKRESVGIFSCGKCSSKFTGRAYSLPKRSQLQEVEHTQRPKARKRKVYEKDPDMEEEQVMQSPEPSDDAEENNE